MHRLATLRELDGLRGGATGDLPTFVHEDHRWVLPIIQHAQDLELLPRPCTLVMFDAHDDACMPLDLNAVKAVLVNGVTLDALINLCKNHLRLLDDDWIVAGMELGAIGDAVIFGAQTTSESQKRDPYTDHRGVVHRIKTLSLPKHSLGYQGNLSDLAKQQGLEQVWDILGWRCENGSFRFVPGRQPILLDLDLDCFVMDWRDYRIPWPDEIFEAEFNQESSYRSTTGWTGKDFFSGLLSKAGCLTIAREPSCCGGDAKAARVLRSVNRYLLDGQLALQRKSHRSVG